MANIVQFIHPGGEHVPSKRASSSGSLIYDWNYSGHKRKFMKVPGQYVDNGALLDGELYFWGEWEPWSEVTLLPASSHIGDFPHCIHSPIYYKSALKFPPYINGKKNQHRQNTDPFVFGDNFLYSICKQRRKTGPTKLTRLETGTIILFGSCIHPNTPKAYFALDTVFVVSEIRSYTPGTFSSDLLGFIPPIYDKIMGFSDWPCKTDKLVAYKGASFHEPFAGMYSFVPCKVRPNAGLGFERAKLSSKELSFITDNLFQGFKAKEKAISDIICVWRTIRNLLKKKGFLEGVQLKYTIK